MRPGVLIPAALLMIASTSCAVHGWHPLPENGPKLDPKLLDREVRLTMATGVVDLVVSQVTLTHLSGRLLTATGGTVEFDLQSARRAEVLSRKPDGSTDRKAIDPAAIRAAPDLIVGRDVQLMTENGFVVLRDATFVAPSFVAGQLGDHVRAWVRVDRRQVLRSEIQTVDWPGTTVLNGGIWLGLLVLSRMLG